MAAGIRRAGPQDAAFLFVLYRSTRAKEFAFLPASQQEPILRMQWEAQSRGYAAQFPNSEDWVILWDGEPAGRVLWCEGPDELRVVDVAVLAQFQNRGLGTYGLGLAAERARQIGKPLRLTVRLDNHAAARLYERLGFIPLRQDLLYVEMEQRAAKPPV